MNYGIGQGGGFGVSIPINGYSTNQGYNYNQNSNWTPNGNWGQPSNQSWGYSQPVYTHQNTSLNTSHSPQGWGYNQPLNQGWNTVQPSGWSGQSYSTSQPVYFQPPQQQYGFHSMPFMSGCGNCGKSTPTIRRDW